MKVAKVVGIAVESIGIMAGIASGIYAGTKVSKVKKQMAKMERDVTAAWNRAHDCVRYSDLQETEKDLYTAINHNHGLIKELQKNQKQNKEEK